LDGGVFAMHLAKLMAFAKSPSKGHNPLWHPDNFKKHLLDEDISKIPEEILKLTATSWSLIMG
jgi:hypothetical protein